MKKILAICLAAMLLIVPLAAMADAAWSDGLSAQKPYAGSPEVDFTESIGYMMLNPSNGKLVYPGADMLQIFMPREDVEIGSGALCLYSEEDGLVQETAAESITMRAMTEAELEDMIWGSGVVFEIALDKPLEANRNYYVQMDEGLIYAPEYEVGSPKIASNKQWRFNTVLQNYVESMSYCRKVEGEAEPVVVEDVQTGDTAKLSIVIGEENASAAIYCDAGSMIAAETYFTADAEIEIKFPMAGEVAWGIMFMDADGNTTYTMDYVTTVNPMAE